MHPNMKYIEILRGYSDYLSYAGEKTTLQHGDRLVFWHKQGLVGLSRSSEPENPWSFWERVKSDNGDDKFTFLHISKDQAKEVALLIGLLVGLIGMVVVDDENFLTVEYVKSVEETLERAKQSQS